MTVLLVMTDGRDTIHDTIASFHERVTGPISHRVIHDDSGDPAHRKLLAETFPEFQIIGGRRLGFAGAISRAWSQIRNLPAQWVFHLEDDFTFKRHVDLLDMAHVLSTHPHIVQMALRRQPWNPQEVEAGGIVEQSPESYSDCTDGEFHWLEQRQFFTTNPSLYRVSLCGQRWPKGSNSEGRFSLDVLTDPDVAFAYWGARNSGEWVTHIGAQRAGRGY